MRLLKWAIVSVISTACIGVEVDLDKANGDSDGDGISDSEEAELGTNPNEEDSDFRGVSIQDIGYNLLGVGLALGMDILIDEIKKTRKEKSKKRKIKNYNFP